MSIRKNINDLALKLPKVVGGYRWTMNLLNTYFRKQHVAMFHSGRCGSSVIAMMLNNHSDIYWGGEVFNNYMHAEKEKGLERKKFVKQTLDWNRSATISKIYGFETKYLSSLHLSERCIDMSFSDYLKCLNELQFTKFIVLHRKNYLRRVVSGEVGRKTKSWHTTKDMSQPTKIKIDLSSIKTGERYIPLLESFHHVDKNFRTLKKNLTGSDALFLTYEEDILEDPTVAYNKICDFLCLHGDSPDIPLGRTNPFSYEEMIENFDEIVEVLTNTEYEWMLNQ